MILLYEAMYCSLSYQWLRYKPLSYCPDCSPTWYAATILCRKSKEWVGLSLSSHFNGLYPTQKTVTFYDHKHCSFMAKPLLKMTARTPKQWDANRQRCAEMPVIYSHRTPSDILPSLTLWVQRGLRASSGSFRKNPPRADTECPTASLHQIPTKAVLCNYSHYTPCGGICIPTLTLRVQCGA